MPYSKYRLFRLGKQTAQIKWSLVQPNSAGRRSAFFIETTLTWPTKIKITKNTLVQKGLKKKSKKKLTRCGKAACWVLTPFKKSAKSTGELRIPQNMNTLERYFPTDSWPIHLQQNDIFDYAKQSLIQKVWGDRLQSKKWSCSKFKNLIHFSLLYGKKLVQESMIQFLRTPLHQEISENP